MDRLARRLLMVAGGLVDTADWVAAARHAWEEAPLGLRRAFREYRRDSGQSGVLLVRNLPVDAENLPDTPMEDGSVVRQATVSAATNFQSGMCDCTISKPGAIHSMQASNWSSEARAGGVAWKPNTHSGSMRGWHRPLRDSSPSPSQKPSVVFHTVPQMGACTP